MESFLSASKKALANLPQLRNVCIVLGNATCDLDSAVSALVQGFSEHLNAIKRNETDLVVIPLLNIPEKEYRVKTEVVYFLNRHDIPSNLLTFRDKIDLIALRKNDVTRLEIVLVDHHTLSEEDAFLADCVIKVIDHRPRDANWPWSGKTVQIETVGSCATLVARDFLAAHPEFVDSLLSSLLRGPILLDTCNLSKEAGRATLTDVQTVEALERIGSSISQRTVVFDELLRAKTDTSELSLDDLLIRDLKIAARVPFVGLPMLVRKFLEFEGALKILEHFADSRGNAIVVLLGMLVEGHEIERDVAIYSLAGSADAEKIIQALTQSTRPNLDLTFRLSVRDPIKQKWCLALYDQGNVRATRKQILPIVRDTIASQCSRR